MVTIGARVGQSTLVERLALANFLARVAESDDPEITLRSQRNEPSPEPRRKLREFVQADSEPATLETIPRNITLSSGKILIEFNRMEELAGSMLALAQILENEFEEFASKFEPVQPASDLSADPVVEDLRRAFAQLRKVEIAKASRPRTTSFAAPGPSALRDGEVWVQALVKESQGVLWRPVIAYELCWPREATARLLSK